MTTNSILLILAASLVQLVASAQINIGIDHDISKPTFGFQGPTSSHISYNDKNGLNLRGTIGDLLGPPIKMVNGFGQMLASTQLAKEGQQLNSKSAILGLDAKLLEAAGLGANLLKGGFLGLGGSQLVGAPKGATLDTKQVEQRASQTNGQKIGSVIEVPVSVVPMSGFGGLGTSLISGGAKTKGEQALAVKTKGEQLMNEAQLMKQQGRNQILEGASESVSTIGNYVQDVGSKASSAIKLLPIILDLPQPGQQQQQQTTKTSGGRQSSGLTGGSFFGGLGSLLAPQDPLNSVNGGGGLWGQQQSHRYAAVLNSTNPFTNLLMNLAPNLQQFNPVLYPLQGSGLAGGPLAQAAQGKQSNIGQTQLYGNGLQALNLFAASQGLNGASNLQQPQHQDLQASYSLFPGIKVRETFSSHPVGQVVSKDQPQQQQKQ